ncbi:MAG: Uma2 family endonuclease [Planctomycetales bacterium]|nr:Uma2 family endonuclease [Planctomycetales bacterium]
MPQDDKVTPSQKLAPEASAMFVITPQIKLGYEEYCLIPNDGNRHEVIDGLHYVSPAPTVNHQAVSRWLQYQMFTRIEIPGLGKVMDAPVDVQLGVHDIVQPDLVVVLTENVAVLTDSRVVGPPDLIVEILSKSTAKHDQTLKRLLYERCGVREYWIADPAACRIDQFVLENGAYRQIDSSATQLTMTIIPDMVIPLGDIWNH